MLKIIKTAFWKIKGALSRSKTDIQFSGSTCICCIIIGIFIYIGNHLFTANLGDSRAVLYKKENDFDLIELSKDHKPDDLEEKTRI